MSAPSSPPPGAGPRLPVVSSREVGGFTLQEARYAPGFGGGIHRHPTAFLGYVVGGDFTETSPRGRALYGRGSLHFHPSDDPHAGVVGSHGARCFNILPAEGLSRRLDAAGDALHGDPWPRHLASLAGRCHRGFLARDAAWDLDCEGLALELLAAVLRVRAAGESGVPGWLFVARDYLHAHAREPVTLAGLAAVCGVHRVHLMRVFRHRLGVTPGGYLRQLRLEIACRALAETRQPIAEIALDAGYSSQAHLTRAFREHLGTTPAAYRRGRRPA